MVIAGLVVAILALVFAIGVPLLIERLKRPSLEITAADWRTPGPLIRTFAVVRIRNKPVARPFSRFLRREVAQGCVVEIDFRHGANREQLFQPIRGRWSSHSEPISNIPSRGTSPYVVGPPASGAPVPYADGTIDPDVYRGVHTGDVEPTSGGTASTFRYAGGTSPVPYAGGHVGPRMNYAPSSYDPTLDPPQQDVGVSQDGEEVAVAILREGEAFAFSTESYTYPEFGKPEWQLTRPTTYYVIVRVRGYNVDQQQAFELPYLDGNFANFRLRLPSPT